ncbi:MAG TPA: M24 family metallopeptidase [Thermoleophilaceae bacterium]|nr:M24 family metallopeptidase [Thermoleophilaceae bacterium]
MNRGINDFPAIGFDAGDAAARLGELGVHGMLLASPENVFYTTGYTALPSSGNPILYTLRNRLPYFSYVDREGEVTLVCWGFSAEGVNFGADRIVGINTLAEALEAVGELARSKSDGTPLGVESTAPRYLGELLREASIETVVVDRLIEDMRLIKKPEELELIRRSTAIIEDCVNQLYGVLEVGMSRADLMHRARTMLVEHGASGISHLTFTFGGSNPEIEIAEPLEAGALVTLDLGAIVGGYCSDNRRYAFMGELPEELRETYDTMVSIVDDVGAMLTPGMSHLEIFNRALELHEERGVPPLARFTHTGHNIGLETEERWLADAEDEVVEAGMAINIELYTNTGTHGQVGDEESYVVTDSEPERISVLPRVIREIS